jgi:hypothetical protein
MERCVIISLILYELCDRKGQKTETQKIDRAGARQTHTPALPTYREEYSASEGLNEDDIHFIADELKQNDLLTIKLCSFLPMQVFLYRK